MNISKIIDIPTLEKIVDEQKNKRQELEIQGNYYTCKMQQFNSVMLISVGVGALALSGGGAVAMMMGGFKISRGMQQVAAIVAVFAFGVLTIVAGYLDHQQRTTYAQISECTMLKNQALDRIRDVKELQNVSWFGWH